MPISQEQKKSYDAPLRCVSYFLRGLENEARSTVLTWSDYYPVVSGLSPASKSVTGTLERARQQLRDSHRLAPVSGLSGRFSRLQAAAGLRYTAKYASDIRATHSDDQRKSCTRTNDVRTGPLAGAEDLI